MARTERPAPKRGARARAVTLILSEDEFLASSALGELRRALEAEGYQTEERSPDDVTGIMEALNTPSLFEGARLVVVREAEALKTAAIEQIARWAGEESEGARLALVAGKGPKLEKGLAGLADVTKVQAPPPWEVSKWVAQRVRRLGRQMSAEAAQALVEAVGTDLRELDSAIELLCGAVEGTIELPDVGRYFRGLESQVWTFVDSVLERDRATALRHLHALLAQGENPIGLVAALARQFRTVAMVREGDRRPAAVIAKDLGVREGSVKRAFRQSRGFETEDVRRVFRLMADADLALKGGEQGEGGPPEVVLELLVADIAGDRPVRSGARGAR